MLISDHIVIYGGMPIGIRANVYTMKYALLAVFGHETHGLKKHCSLKNEFYYHSSNSSKQNQFPHWPTMEDNLKNWHEIVPDKFKYAQKILNFWLQCYVNCLCFISFFLQPLLTGAMVEPSQMKNLKWCEMNGDVRNVQCALCIANFVSIV